MSQRNLISVACVSILVLAVSGSLHGQLKPHSFLCTHGGLPPDDGNYDENVKITWYAPAGTTGVVRIYANGQEVVSPPPSVGAEQVDIPTRNWAANDYRFEAYL